jgi:hypothetical protein
MRSPDHVLGGVAAVRDNPLMPAGTADKRRGVAPSRPGKREAVRNAAERIDDQTLMDEIGLPDTEIAVRKEWLEFGDDDSSAWRS